MSAVPFAYPASRFEPSLLVDLNSKAERERLSRSALRGFFKILTPFKLPPPLPQFPPPLGLHRPSPPPPGDRLADEWVGIPNNNVIFGGRTPLATMLAGGLVAIQTVRKLLDARRGGGW